MNIISNTTLTYEQIQDIRSLEILCRKADNISFGLFTEPELNEASDMPCFFMLYDTEHTTLLAFLSMFVPGDGTAEISACTHPKYRRKGFFDTLCQKARETAAEHGITSLTFAISPTQQTAFKVLARHGAVLENTEYLLQYKKTDACPKAGTASAGSCRLSPALPDEFEIHADIFAKAFGYPDDSAKDLLKDILSSASDVKAFSFTDASGNIIGCCYADIDFSQVMPFGICIRFDMQGQKLGQHMISLLINDYLLQYKRPILLQVSGSNENALHIYKKIGFEAVSQVDYFRIDMV